MSRPSPFQIREKSRLMRQVIENWHLRKASHKVNTKRSKTDNKIGRRVLLWWITRIDVPDVECLYRIAGTENMY